MERARAQLGLPAHAAADRAREARAQLGGVAGAGRGLDPARRLVVAEVVGDGAAVGVVGGADAGGGDHHLGALQVAEVDHARGHGAAVDVLGHVAVGEDEEARRVVAVGDHDVARAQRVVVVVEREADVEVVEDGVIVRGQLLRRGQERRGGAVVGPVEGLAAVVGVVLPVVGADDEVELAVAGEVVEEDDGGAALERDRLRGRGQAAAVEAGPVAQAAGGGRAAGRATGDQIAAAVTVDVGVREHRQPAVGAAEAAEAEVGHQRRGVGEGRVVGARQRRGRGRRIDRVDHERAAVEEDLDRAGVVAVADEEVELAVAVEVDDDDVGAAPALGAEVGRTGAGRHRVVAGVEAGIARGVVAGLVEPDGGDGRRRAGRGLGAEDVGPAVAVEVGGRDRAPAGDGVGGLELADHDELGHARRRRQVPVGLGVLVGVVLVDADEAAALAEADEVFPAVLVEVGDRREHGEIRDAERGGLEQPGRVLEAQLAARRGVEDDAVLGRRAVEGGPGPRGRRRRRRTGRGGGDRDRHRHGGRGRQRQRVQATPRPGGRSARTGERRGG